MRPGIDSILRIVLCVLLSIRVPLLSRENIHGRIAVVGPLGHSRESGESGEERRRGNYMKFK